MPLFLSRNLIFIHIPKTGGTSIEKCLEDNGVKMSFYTFTGAIFINKHTPQHCTIRELESLNILNNDFQIFTVVRNPVDRVISAFFYLKKYRPDICQYFRSFDEFLDLFLDYQNLELFDNHNLSQFDYLKNHEGKIPKVIKIFKFFDHERLEEFLMIRGLKKYQIYKSQRFSFEPNENQKKRIRKFYSDDFRELDFDLHK